MKEEPKDSDRLFMRAALDMAVSGMEKNEGGPFGAVIVKDGAIIGRGNNRVILTNDPTAHAEIVAIKDACSNLRNFQLDGCTIYTTCEPCPMCLGAIYWARIDKMFYACTKKDAAAIGFDDAFIYEEFPLPLDERKIRGICLDREAGLNAFKIWTEKNDKTLY